MKNLRWSARAKAVTVAALVIVIGTMLTVARPAAAQVYTGRIDLSVSDRRARCCPASPSRSLDRRRRRRSPTRRERRTSSTSRPALTR